MTKLIAQKPLGVIDGIGNFIVDADGSKQGVGVIAARQIDIIFSTIVTFLTVVGGLTFLIYFIIGAISWITAGGDAKKVDNAKSYMTNGAVGLIIIVAAYSIVGIVSTILGLNILNPGATINHLFNR